MLVAMGPGLQRRDAEPDQRRHILGAGPAVPLVPTSGEQGRDAGATANPQRAGPLGTAELVAGQRQQVDAQVADVHAGLAHGLDGIGVEDGAGVVGHSRQLDDGLQRANLVVGVHHRDQGGLWRHDLAEGLGADAPRAVGGDQAQRPTAPGQVLAGVEDSLVLDGAGHQVGAPARFQSFSHASDREVVGLGAAGGPDQVVGLGADQGGHARPCQIQLRFGLLPKSVHTRGVAEVFGKGLGHAFENRGMEGRRGVVVEIDPHDALDHSIAANPQQ